jgi:hypothetical protein
VSALTVEIFSVVTVLVWFQCILKGIVKDWVIVGTNALAWSGFALYISNSSGGFVVMEVTPTGFSLTHPRCQAFRLHAMTKAQYTTRATTGEETPVLLLASEVQCLIHHWAGLGFFLALFNGVCCGVTVRHVTRMITTNTSPRSVHLLFSYCHSTP